MEEINSFEKIQPFLDATPMTDKNVELTIFFTLPNGRTPVHPDLCCISLSKGIVEYNTEDPEDRFKYYSTEKETYEEALKIVEHEIGHSIPQSLRIIGCKTALHQQQETGMGNREFINTLNAVLICPEDGRNSLYPN